MKRHGKRFNGTRKSTGNGELGRQIVAQFLEFLMMVKLYHWKTFSYATHKATDDLYSKIGANMDTFVEVLLGKMASQRINLSNTKSIPLKDMHSPEEFKKEVEKFREYLINLTGNKMVDSVKDSDLLNIRDEILGDVNQFLYLYTFK